MNPDDSIATRETLIERLRKWDDHASWQEFFDLYWRLIHRVAIKAGLDEDEAQEVVHDTVVTASRNLPEFRYEPERCAFKTWLLNLTRWRIVDQIRKRARATAMGASEPRAPDEIEQIPDPAGCALEKVWDQEWELNLLEAATQRVKQQVAPKQYQMFYLHALKDVPVGEVARRVGASIGSVYLAKHRIGRMLKRELKVMQEGAV